MKNVTNMANLEAWIKTANKTEIELTIEFVNKLQLKIIRKEQNEKRFALRRMERVVEAMEKIGFKITAEMKTQLEELKTSVETANKLFPKKAIDKKDKKDKK